MLGISPFFARRMRALGPEAPPEEDYLDMPEVEPLTQAADAYTAHLAQVPVREDPGLGKTLLSTLAASLAGFGENSAIRGATLGRSIIEEPYRRSLDEYNKKAKVLGDVADLETERNKEKRLLLESRLNREERRRAAKAREDEAEARRLAAAQKPPRAMKGDIEFDNQGFGTGRIYDHDEQKMKYDPALVGFRRNQEPAGLTNKKAETRLAIYTAKELKTTFDNVTKKFSNPILGNTKVGPVQGKLSELWSAAGGEKDPDVINMHKIAQELANATLYALSGAQINNKEYERLRKTLPDTSKGEAAFVADIERFIKFHEAALAGLISENDVDWTPETPTNAPSSTNVPQGIGATTLETKVPNKRKYNLEIERY